MVVALLQLSLRLAASQSLKEKRRHLKGLIGRIRARFNVSVAEVGSQDTWQSALVAVVHVANDRARANAVLDQVLNQARAADEIEVLDSDLSFY